jgi:hypothetical protein
LIEKTSGANLGGDSRPSRCELDGVEIACPGRRRTRPGEQRQPPAGRQGQADGQRHHADLGHAQRAIAHDQPAAAHRRQEARDGSDRDIHADQRRIDTEIGDDGRRDQRHRRAPIVAKVCCTVIAPSAR